MEASQFSTNTDIPSLDEIRAALSDPILRNIQTVSHKPVTIESLGIDSWSDSLPEPRPKELILWINTLLGARNDIHVVRVSHDAHPTPDQIALLIDPKSVDELPVLVVLETERQAAVSVRDSNNLVSAHSHRRKTSLNIPAGDIIYINGVTSLSIRSLQPPSYTKNEIYIRIANFSHEENEKLFSEKTTGGGASNDLQISERSDSDGLMDILHEVGHQWAFFFKIDKRSDEQRSLRTQRSFANTNKSLFSVHKEIIFSERLANTIARFLRRKVSKDGFEIKRTDKLHKNLQSYDIKRLLFALKNNLNGKLIKSLLGSSRSRSELQIETSRKIFEFILSQFEEIDELKPHRKPDYHFPAFPGFNELDSDSWKTISTNNRDVELIIFKNDSNIVQITINISDGQYLQTLTIDEGTITLLEGEKNSLVKEYEFSLVTKAALLNENIIYSRNLINSFMSMVK